MTQSRRRSDFSFSFSEWKTTTDFCERTLEEWKEPFVRILLLMTAAPPPHHHRKHHHSSTAREELNRACVVLLLLASAMLQGRLPTPPTSALTQPPAIKKLNATFTLVSRSIKRQAPQSSAHLGFSVIPLSNRPPQIYVNAPRRGQCGQIKATAVEFMGSESRPGLITEDSRPLKDDLIFRSSSKEPVVLFQGLHHICTWCLQLLSLTTLCFRRMYPGIITYPYELLTMQSVNCL